MNEHSFAYLGWILNSVIDRNWAICIPVLFLCNDSIFVIKFNVLNAFDIDHVANPTGFLEVLAVAN
ncbi:hypothetical protein MAH1_28660 [Sessilibacter sp. MAH1]